MGFLKHPATFWSLIALSISLSLWVTISRSSPDAETLIIAIKPDKNPDAMEADRLALVEALGAATGRPVEVIVPTSGAVVEQGLANGTIDAAFVSSTSLARYSAEGEADLLLAIEQDGATTYESFWVALAEAPLASVSDLAGHAVCFASPTSTSGFIIPTHDLGQQGLLAEGDGLEAFFGAGNVQFGTGYVSAVQRVLRGLADAAAVSDYVMEGDAHLSPEEKAQLKVIDRQGPVPTHVLAVRSSLDSEDQATIKAAFLGLNTATPELNDRAFNGQWTEVDAEVHLAPIREALAFASELKGR